MRCWIIGFGCLLCATAAAETFPHKATVVSLNVTARSGESFGTYPTERLAKHSQVEVRQAGASGWVAIAPPKDAFDWLPAAAVKLSEDRKTGEVIVAAAPAYIGSNVRKIEEHVSQTDLKRGDTVHVLTVKGNWLKIAPPPGEVRWVQEKHLSTNSPEQLAAAETEERLTREDRYRRENATNPPGLLADLLQGREVAEARRDESIERAQFLRRNRPALLSRKPRERTPKKEESAPSVEIDNGKASDAIDMEVGTDASPRSAPQIVKPTPPLPRVSLDPKNSVKEAGTKTASDKDQNEETHTPTSEPPPVRSETQIPPIDSQEFKKRLTQLDVDLTTMVAQDSSQWDLPPLRQRAEELVQLGPSPLARGKARLLLDRIAEFASTLPPAETGVLSQTTQPIAAEPTTRQPDFATQYDAMGYLMPIVGSRPGLPQYQLTDKDGRSLSLVTARPGINLNAYVKKQVGLYGQRGYVDSLKKPHILAERVVDLEVQRR
jgi:hypothetical protein